MNFEKWSAENIMKGFERGYQAIFYRSAPFVAAVGMGSLYTFIIQGSIEGPAGWILGPILAAGLEFGGMHTISIAAKERSRFWIIASSIYVLTHILTLVFIEILHGMVGAEILIGMAIIVSSVLAYISKGYKSEIEEKESRRIRLQEGKRADKVEERRENLQAQKDKIDLDHYKQMKDEEARNLKLENKKKRSSMKVRNSSSEIVRKSSDLSGFIPFSELPPEKQVEITELSWEKYRTKYEQKHGEIKRTKYYEIKKSLRK